MATGKVPQTYAPCPELPAMRPHGFWRASPLKVRQFEQMISIPPEGDCADLTPFAYGSLAFGNLYLDAVRRCRDAPAGAERKLAGPTLYLRHSLRFNRGAWNETAVSRPRETGPRNSVHLEARPGGAFHLQESACCHVSRSICAAFRQHERASMFKAEKLWDGSL